ncbi:alpha/beta hydrolase family protein [Sphingomonas phyllosphaerae]|uniref:alpha/beta hydrolase family protein n=1 Tax=Sphingomonas phyllosphaerae TaxID=257003 RepID=UPI0003B711E5|nr:alpha/beta hydrolase [Sphingomonas phyllosphaerae]
MIKRRWLIGGGAIVALAAIWWLVPIAYMLWMVYWHGPPALERLPVSKPAASLHYGPAAQQVEELRLPAGAGPFPVAVVIHGGCWDASIGGTARSIAPLADALTRRGLATLNVDYRQLGQAGGGWPGTFRDAGAAIDSLRPLARRYPIDLKRVIVVGHSAGALLATWSAIRPSLSSSSDIYAPDPVRPAAVVAIDGPGSLAEFIGKDKEICDKSVIVPLMGGTPARVPQRYRDASAQDHLPLGVPQYIAQGAFADLMQGYVARARRAGDPVDVYRTKRPSHFRIINPTEPEGAGTVALILRGAAASERQARAVGAVSP